MDFAALRQEPRTIANTGAAVGQVINPTFMCESYDGNIMVSNHNNKRMQEFFLDDRPPRVVVQFNDGTFPRGITQCGNGDYIVADYAKHRVMRMDSNGTIKWTVGSQGNGRDQFTYPYGVAMLLDGRVVVADCHNHRLQVLNANTGAVEGTLTRSDGVAWKNPIAIAVDTQGLVYVVDRGNHRVVVVKVDGSVVRTLGSQGQGQGQLQDPWAITVDGNGNVLVGDCGNDRVVVFHTDGTSTHFATPGQTYDVLIASNNRVVVSGGHFVVEY